MRTMFSHATRASALTKIIASGLLGLLLWPVAPAAQSAAAPLEYQVKASYLYNFMQFIAWPADVFDAHGKFNMCVLGPERFGAVLDGFAGERVEEREIVVHRLTRVAQAQALRCHMLFISAGAADANVISERGLLVISETPGFLERGGIINLVEILGRIRFEINQEAAQRAGLVVSSRVLSLALNKP